MKITIEKSLGIIRRVGRRNLEEKFQELQEELVKKIDSNEKVNNPIIEKDLKELLGVQKFNYGEIEEENRLAWLQV